MTPNQHKMIDWALTLLMVLELVFGVVYFGHATDNDPLTLERRKTLTIALQSALLTQGQWQQAGCQQLSMSLTAGQAEWTRVQADIAKEAGLPEGTTFQAKDLKAMQFTIIPPPPKGPEASSAKEPPAAVKSTK